MSKGLPIWIVEPEQENKRELTALRVSQGGQKRANIPPKISVPELKDQLKKIRENARDDIDTLTEKLKSTFKQSCSQADIILASDAKAAADYIYANTTLTKTVSTNNSVTVQEIRAELVRAGLSVINSYYSEFNANEKKVLDYWDLPRLLDKDLASSFEVVAKMEGLSETNASSYAAVLGVNAIAAEDGTVLFLEHYSNIKNDLERAEKVFLLVGLDKIVRNAAEAKFQTQCMGIFGAENILLGIEPKALKQPGIAHLELPVSGLKRELHVILLDNGRRNIIKTKYKDLFFCIGCRACNKHCPIRHSLVQDNFIWTPKTYLTDFLRGNGDSLDVCLHCEACRMECPVDIDLPYLMWQAKLDQVAAHGTSLSHKMLGRPEILAKLGTIAAPLSNWAMNQKIVRTPMEKLTGIDKRTKLPVFHRKTFRKSLKKGGAS
jgi:L-lactate utilization protein LutB